MARRKNILINKEVLNGNPYIEGTKLTVFDIVSDCKYDGIKTFLEASRELSVDDLRWVFEYCKLRQCEKGGSHCGGCSLRSEQDGIYNQEDFINRFAEIRFADSDKILKGTGQGMMIMPGTPESLPQNWRGEDGWLIAAELLDELDRN